MYTVCTIYLVRYACSNMNLYNEKKTFHISKTVLCSYTDLHVDLVGPGPSMLTAVTSM